MDSAAPPAPKPTVLRRLLPALGLLLLAPVCAEYLIGYDQIIGRPLELLTGLLYLAPLYGTVAVLIRETARRTGRGWPTILLLSAAFGLVQAGLVDQSLFNPDFVDEPSWDRDRMPTYVPVLGVSVKQVLGFVGGHVIWSFAAPVAVVEACVPRLARRPWLGRAGTVVMAVLYLLAVVVFTHEHTRTFMASPVRLGVTAAVVLALVAAAFAVPRRPAGASRRTVSRRAVSPWAAGGAAVVLLAAHQLSPPTWTGAALDAAVLALGGGLLLWCSRAAGWGGHHVPAVAGAALLVNAGLSFAVDPLGEVSLTVKYTVNAALTVAVLALLAGAHLRVRGAGAGERAGAARHALRRTGTQPGVPPAG
ncbi:hypothetical protein WDV06_10935 [Streptomyces racemochromogenes]|uniref:Integral membrane protein n=1 Tax=Streptomyces racemochromogenes TaxID=67353 RepID=A0ABW7PC69_9ACTN